MINVIVYFYFFDILYIFCYQKKIFNTILYHIYLGKPYKAAVCSVKVETNHWTLCSDVIKITMAIHLC